MKKVKNIKLIYYSVKSHHIGHPIRLPFSQRETLVPMPR